MLQLTQSNVHTSTHPATDKVLNLAFLDSLQIRSSQTYMQAADHQQDVTTTAPVLKLQALLYVTKLSSLVHNAASLANSKQGLLPLLIHILRGHLQEHFATPNAASQQHAASTQHLSLMKHLTKLQVQVATVLLQDALTMTTQAEPLPAVVDTLIAVLTAFLQSASLASTAAEEFCKQVLFPELQLGA